MHLVNGKFNGARDLAEAVRSLGYQSVAHAVLHLLPLGVSASLDRQGGGSRPDCERGSPRELRWLG
jgi:hypothetical protein